MKYTFKIRDGIFFHNEDKLTADDVVFSMKRLLEVKRGFSYLYEGLIKDITKSADNTVEENVRKYGFENKLASFRSVELGVLDFQDKKDLAEERILREAERAVKEDGAEVVVLGCTKEFGFFQKVQDNLGVPVIDSMIAACKEAEFLVSCKNMLNWTTSKVGAYETPKDSEIRQWKLDKYFHIPMQ